MVDPASIARKANATDKAVLLVEVLSPSTKAANFNAKRSLYASLPSLEIYIVASQDEPRLWIWQRGRDGTGSFPDTPVEIDDRAAPIHLGHFGSTITLGEIYAHVFPG